VSIKSDISFSQQLLTFAQQRTAEHNRTFDVDIRLDVQKISNILWEKFLKLTGHKDKHVKYNIFKI